MANIDKPEKNIGSDNKPSVKLPTLKSLLNSSSETRDNLNLPSIAIPEIVLPSLPPQQPISALIEDDKIKKAKTDTPVVEEDYPPLKPHKAPTIKVEYQNLDQKNAAKPNFIIKDNGTIECVRNPEAQPPTANIIIQVERKDKQVGEPDKIQKKAVDNLVDYLAKRVENNYQKDLPTLKLKDGQIIHQVSIVDNQNLVSDSLEQKFGNKIPPSDLAVSPPYQPQLPQNVSNLSGSMQQVEGSNGGSTHIDRTQLSDTIPQIQGIPQAPHESNSIIAAQQMVASLFHPDSQNPYQTVRESNGIGYQVGNYGLNQNNIGNFLESFLTPDILDKLGHPPDWSKLAKLLKDDPQLLKEFEQELQKALIAQAEKLIAEANKNNLPSDDKLRLAATQLESFAAKFNNPQFASNFANLISDMSGKNGTIDKTQVATLLPVPLQDLIAKYNIQDFAKQLHVTDINNLSANQAGQIALAFYLGHMPAQSDLQQPQDSQFVTAAANMYRLSKAQLGSMGDITVSDNQGKIAVVANNDLGKSMWTHYLNNGNLGCAASVSEVLQELGYSYANSALVVGLQHQLQAHGWTQVTHPEPGDVVMGYRNSDSSGGGGAHTGIVGYNNTVYDNHSSTGRWSQDHLDYFSDANFRAGVIFLKPPQS